MTHNRIFCLLGMFVLVAAVSTYGQSSGRRGPGRGSSGVADVNGQRHDHTADFADRIARMYELTPEEREVVRAKLGELHAQRANFTDPSSRSRGGWETVMEQIESVIPPEKAEKGRQRRQEWQQRFSQQRQARQNQPQQPQTDGGSSTDSTSDRAGRRDRSERDRGNRDRSRRDVGGADRRGRDRGDEAVADARDDWQRYVDRFCDRYKLDNSQRGTAQTILRECMERRDKIRQESRDEMAKTIDIENAKERMEKIQELKKPAEAVFQELKDRLEQIPTTTQRLDAPAPTSAPTTRPFGRRSRRG